MNNEIIAKLLKSSNVEDTLLGLELQYQSFKKGYTNLYKRGKYNREFRSRIRLLLNIGSYNNQLTVNTIWVAEWFRNRLEEDFTNEG